MRAAPRAYHQASAGTAELQSRRLNASADPPDSRGSATDSSFHGVVVRGDLAYLATIRDLRIFDVSSPAAPVELSRYDDTGITNDVAISGDFAFLAAHDEGVRVVDISDPSSPFEVGHLASPGLGQRVTVAGGLAFLSEGLAVEVEGGYACVATEWTGLRIIDVRNPADPVEVGHLEGINPEGLAVRDGLAFVASPGDGLAVLDVRNPTDPRLVGLGGNPRGGFDVALDGDLAVVADYWSGVVIFDVSSCRAPLGPPRLPAGRRVPD